jgi:hypothetical protein
MRNSTREASTRVDCASCGYHLGYLRQEQDGALVNVDPREQSKPPRLALVDGLWCGHCKCGAKPRLRDDSLRASYAAARAAGLRRFPFRALPR